MGDEKSAQLSIVTSMSTGIVLHPLIGRNSFSESGNSFLEYFRIEFHKPDYHQATVTRSIFAPLELWFGLFDEAEKVIMDGDQGFYGVMYETQVKLANKRVERLLEKIEKTITSKPTSSKENQADWQTRRIFRKRDEIRDTETALRHFDPSDKITLTFIFAEWPTPEQARRRDYIKEFEEKLLKLGQDEEF